MKHAPSRDGVLDRLRQQLNTSGQSACRRGISPASRRVRGDGSEPDGHRVRDHLPTACHRKSRGVSEARRSDPADRVERTLLKPRSNAMNRHRLVMDGRFRDIGFCRMACHP